MSEPVATFAIMRREYGFPDAIVAVTDDDTIAARVMFDAAIKAAPLASRPVSFYVVRTLRHDAPSTAQKEN